jgi:excisionase family DNA binding protein
MSDAELLTPQQAADVLKVPVCFIYERTRKNAIPLRRYGKYVRIPKDELLAWGKRGEEPVPT